jgi:hypothetical protein
MFYSSAAHITVLSFLLGNYFRYFKALSFVDGVIPDACAPQHCQVIQKFLMLNVTWTYESFIFMNFLSTNNSCKMLQQTFSQYFTVI